MRWMTSTLVLVLIAGCASPDEGTSGPTDGDASTESDEATQGNQTVEGNQTTQPSAPPAPEQSPANETTQPEPARADPQTDSFSGSLTVLEDSETVTINIVEGHAELTVDATASHTVDGQILLTLSDPNGAEVATSEAGVAPTLTIESPVGGLWTLTIELASGGVDATYEGTWCAGC